MKRPYTRTYSTAERFWSKVALEGECWVWQAGIHRSGYGAFWDEPMMRLAHRWAYEAMVGEIPEGLHLDHLCRNRACVNPWHLDPVTPAVNTQRGDGAHGGKGALLQAAKTHCPSGHLLSGPNLYITPARHGRRCRICRRASTEKTRARRRAERTQ